MLKPYLLFSAGLCGLFALLTSSPAAAQITAPPPAASFRYQPPAPVGGTLKGVVELGATGFNSFLVRIDKQRRWKLEKAEFGNSKVMENFATEEDIQAGLRKYIATLTAAGVKGNDIHFLVSSGAAQAQGTVALVRSLRMLGYVVTVVSAEEEGKYAARVALPAAYQDRAFVMDMGSTNTKLAWRLGSNDFTSVSTYGSRYTESSVPAEKVAADAQAKARQVPAAARPTCFVIGGLPYELVRPLRQGQERYTVLPAPAYFAGREGAKLKAGMNIYQAVITATGCQQFVFDWDANFTIGYLLSLK